MKYVNLKDYIQQWKSACVHLHIHAHPEWIRTILKSKVENDNVKDFHGWRFTIMATRTATNLILILE